MAKNGISRRDFLKGAAVGSAGAVGAYMLGGAPGISMALAEPVADKKAGEPASSTGNVYALNPQDYNYRDTNTDFKTLFSDWKLGPLVLHHRMVKSAAGSDTAVAGNQEELVTYYSNFAKGGVEMVWVEDYVNLYPHYPNKRKKEKNDAFLRELAEGVHSSGGYVGYQLSCMGYAFSGFDPSKAALYDSAYAEHLSIGEIETLKADFVEGAIYLKEQGFDGVEINAAGNNIGQAFFSRQRNHREDQYGPQSFENRARFVSEIVAAIKDACGKDFIVQVLINGIEENDIDIGQSALSTTVEENCEICKQLELAGADSLHVRLGVFRMHVNQFAADLYFTGYGIDGTAANGTQFDFSRHFQGLLQGNHSGCGMMLDVAAKIKEAVRIPVGTVTYMDPAHAPKLFEDALKDGKIDFMLMTRPLTVDFNYVNKLREGRRDEIAPCTRCLHCHFDYTDEGKRIERCRVNACTQRAFREDMPEGYTPLPADKPKKVMVVGGGPAGMEAARIAAERGHKVSLFEQKGYLGGLLLFANAIKGPHENISDYNNWLKRQLELQKISVTLNTKVDAAIVADQKPDVVVLAVGGIREHLGFANVGRTNVISIDDIVSSPVGDKVTIVGGNLQAVDAAQYLIAQGKHVTIVMPDDIGRLDRGQSAWVKAFTVPMLYARGTRVWPNASVVSVEDGYVMVRGDTGIDIRVACDTLIEAMDMLPNKELADRISGCEVVAVGDCNTPANILEAVAAGNLAARSI